MYHFYRMCSLLGKFKGSWDEFFRLIHSGKIMYGTWFDHVKSWAKLLGHPGVLLLKYEDIKEDPYSAVRELDRFLQTSINEEELNTIVEMTRFSSMKANPKANVEKVPLFDNSVSKFLRKGEVGDWKNNFTTAQNSWLQKQYEHQMADCNLSIRFEI